MTYQPPPTSPGAKPPPARRLSTPTQPTAPAGPPLPPLQALADHVIEPLDVLDPGYLAFTSPVFTMGGNDDGSVMTRIMELLTARHEGEPVPPVAVGGLVYAYSPRRGYWVSLDRTALAQYISQAAVGRGLYYEGKNSPARWRMAAGSPKTLADALALHLRADDPHPLTRPEIGLVFAQGFVRATPDGPNVSPNGPGNGATWGYPDITFTPMETLFDTAPEMCMGSLYNRFFWGNEDGPGLWPLDPDRLASAPEVAERATRIWLLHEFLYAALTGQATRFKRALIVEGAKGTGKSQLCDIATFILADIHADPRGLPDGVCCVEPQVLGDLRRGADLQGQALNVVNDLGNEAITAKSHAAIKRVVHGEPVTHARLYQPAESFRPRAAHLYACNDLPELVGVDDAFMDRWAVVRWDAPEWRGTDHEVENIGRQVAGFGIVKAPGPDGRQALDVPACVAARSLLLSCLVHAGCQLEARGRYLLPAMHVDRVKHWRSKLDPFELFRADFLEMLPPDTKAGSWTRLSSLYIAFEGWAMRGSYSMKGRNRGWFKEKLKAANKAVRVKSSDGQRINMRLVNNPNAD